jgi:imidazolonepropionase-like amidohydrolase
VAEGISPLYSLSMATINAAELLGVADRGELANGKRADIIAVDGNPLDNISSMENVRFVMKHGEIYKNE